MELAIIQPRANHKEGPYRIWETNTERLILAHSEFIEAVKACEDPKAKLYAGSHCKFCPAISFCPEVGNQALRSAQEDFK